jgi:hypothetical protein
VRWAVEAHPLKTRRPRRPGGCEPWPYASVSGSCPPVAVAEPDTNDGEDRDEDLHGEFPSLLLELTEVTVSSSARPLPYT